MLKELRIKNLAIIEDLTVRFERGLNVLTGETGAGKSIIVDALGLALGNRAQSDLIRAGEKEASVQACFEVDDTRMLPEVGIDPLDVLILRRILLAGGKSRAYINDNMVTLQTLAGVGRSLVDIHSQHEHQGLLSADRQRTLLDSYGRLEKRVEQVGSLFEEVKALRRQCDELKDLQRERSHRLDLLRFQAAEIAAAALKPGEKESLQEERVILSNVSRLKELSEEAYSLLYGLDGSCSEKLSAALGKLKEMSSVDPAISETAGVLDSAVPLIEEAVISLRGYRERYDPEPGRLESVEERMAVIRGLEKKYGEGIDAVEAYRAAAEREIRDLESTDERRAETERTLLAREEELGKASEGLSAERRKTAGRLEELTVAILRDLSFENARFRIEIEREDDENGKPRIGKNGMDRVEFRFSANQGEPLKPLSRIISGGELSRVMLALKSVLADLDSVPVLIFDEVDAGIGGKTAGSVGEKLDSISQNHQLLCITHLPQIASFADVHLKIEKKMDNERTFVEVRELSGKERKDEIARMLSGTITEISRRHAGEMLERVK